jgi:hypothetical protein
MSMNARFVQVDQAELAKLVADPTLAEALFEGDLPALPPQFAALANVARERMRAAGPQVLADKLSRLDPRLREQIEKSMGRFMSSDGATVLKMMQERLGRRPDTGSRVASRTVLSIDKAWHGVHYLLCGEVEPGSGLLSQVVMGGAALGDDDEGFSGYGPARYFTAAQVAEIGQALSRPELETEAAARFDAGRMSELKIYPGWRASDAEWVTGAFRQLRDFYSDAARQGRAIVTCLV